VFGVVESGFAASVGLGSVLAALLVSLGGIRAALIATGVFLPTLVVLFGRQLLSLDAARAAEHVDALRAIPIFAPLPGPVLEGLARSLRPVQVAAGDTLFRVGDEGDRFYIVLEGEMEIDLDAGTKVEGPGGWFGEIALLRDVPRTATVSARTDTELLALDRREFLAAVTGHAHSYAAANAVASERVALSTT
jgi:hypothetical protein